MFHSIQGEGVWAGTPMFFIRLAGCNVGKYIAPLDCPEDPPTQGAFQILHPEYATCTSFAGESFICDTDYRVKQRLTAEEIIDQLPPTQHIVLTGGEPFIHKDLLDLCNILYTATRAMIHIETSGTLLISDSFSNDQFWITCSPKWGFLKENPALISEYKFLVRGEDDEKAVQAFIDLHDLVEKIDTIWIQPVDEVILTGAVPDHASVRFKTNQQRDFAINCVKRHPYWRLSVQMHKFLGVR